MYQQNQQSKQQKSFSEKTKARIKEAGESTRCGETLPDLTLDAFGRIARKYFNEITPLEYAQITKYVVEKFKYLTNDDIELAFDLAISDEIDADYKPGKLTIKYVHSVLKNYAGATYKLRMGETKKDASPTTGEDRYNRVIRHVKAFHYMPGAIIDCVEIVEWLIGANMLSAPEDWENCSFTEKLVQSEALIKGHINDFFPGVLLFETPQSGPGNIANYVKQRKA